MVLLVFRNKARLRHQDVDCALDRAQAAVLVTAEVYRGFAANVIEKTG